MNLNPSVLGINHVPDGGQGNCYTPNKVFTGGKKITNKKTSKKNNKKGGEVDPFSPEEMAKTREEIKQKPITSWNNSVAALKEQGAIYNSSKIDPKVDAYRQNALNRLGIPATYQQSPQSFAGSKKISTKNRNDNPMDMHKLKGGDNKNKKDNKNDNKNRNEERRDNQDGGEIELGGGKYKVRVGPRGGKYVLRLGKKVYLNV